MPGREEDLRKERIGIEGDALDDLIELLGRQVGCGRLQFAVGGLTGRRRRRWRRLIGITLLRIALIGRRCRRLRLGRSDAGGNERTRCDRENNHE